MQDRIKEIRKHYKLTQTEFGERIGVKGNTITGYETGIRNPSDAVIVSICREFNVNEIWLKSGIGDPFVPLSREDRITDILSKAIDGPSTARDRLIRALARLPDDAFPLIEQYILDAADSIRNEKKE